MCDLSLLCQQYFTYTLLLPLKLGVCHHALHALLHAPPLRQLPVQPLLPRLQLLLKCAFVLLIHLRSLLQDVDLKRGNEESLERKKHTTCRKE